jgi:hypothetical protein
MNHELILTIIALCYFVGGLTLFTFNIINYYYNTALPQDIYQWYIFILLFILGSSLTLITYIFNVFSKKSLYQLSSFIILLVFYNLLLLFGINLISFNPRILFYQLFYYLLFISCLINLLLSYQIIQLTSLSHDLDDIKSSIIYDFGIKATTYRITLIFTCVMAFMYYPLYLETKYYNITDGFQNIKNYYI